MRSITQLIKDLIPGHFHRDDSFKDADNQGLLMRFLETLGEDIDNTLIPKLENYLEIREIDITDGQFIDYLAEFYGNPPDILSDQEYRYLLKYITSLYKIKGTRRAFEVYFSILGLKVQISEYWVTPKLYDEFNFDEDESKYDQDGCNPCSEYEIIFWDKTADCENPTQANIDKALLDKLHQVVFLNQPINAVLRELIYSVPLCDAIRLCVNQEVNWELLRATKWDNFDLDDGVKYDEFTSIGTGQVEDLNCGFAPKTSFSEVTTAADVSLNFLGLLDEHPGGVRAFSFKYLKNTTTNVIKLRRASTGTEKWFTPLDVFNGTALAWGQGSWMLATEWVDQALGFNYTFNVPEKQPIFSMGTDLVRDANGFPALLFRADIFNTLYKEDNHADLSAGLSMYAVYTPLTGYGEDNTSPLFGIADATSHPDGELVVGLSVGAPDIPIELDSIQLSREDSQGNPAGSRMIVASSIDTSFIIGNIPTSSIGNGAAQQSASDAIPKETLMNNLPRTNTFTTNRQVDADYMNTAFNSTTASDYGSVLVSEIIIFNTNHNSVDLKLIHNKQISSY